jgi:hypothetical protein
MTDIAYWNKEYKKEVDNFEECIVELSSLIEGKSTNTRRITKTILECDAKAAGIKEIKKSFGLELRLIKDREQKRDYDLKMKALDERVMIMNKDMKLIKMNQNKEELFQEKQVKFQYSTEGESGSHPCLSAVDYLPPLLQLLH